MKSDKKSSSNVGSRTAVPVYFAFQNIKEEADWLRKERRHYRKLMNISNVFPVPNCQEYEGSSVWPEYIPTPSQKRHFGGLPTQSFLDNYF